MATGEYRSRMTPTRPAPASLWKRFAVGLLVTAVATLLAMTLVDPVLGVLVAAGSTVLAVASAFAKPGEGGQHGGSSSSGGDGGGSEGVGSGGDSGGGDGGGGGE